VLVTGSLFLVAEARAYYGLAPDLSEENSVNTDHLPDSEPPVDEVTSDQ
jgi:hypothetical protein